MKNKTLAVCLALTLGSLGIHRFYLGQPKYGWFYLGFCWSLIPLLLSIIDAICLYSMTYAEFNRRYTLRHVFKKKFEDDEDLHWANFEHRREEELLSKVEEMKNKNLLKSFLENAKNEGNYLPRTVYARAKAIMEDHPGKMENTID